MNGFILSATGKIFPVRTYCERRDGATVAREHLRIGVSVGLRNDVAGQKGDGHNDSYRTRPAAIRHEST